MFENEILKNQLREIRKQKREIKERLEREKNQTTYRLQK